VLKGVNKMPEWLTIDEAAEYMRCSRSTIYRRIKSGELKVYKTGKLARVKKEDLDNLFHENKE
jgi:excisionase family DNA binding protein